MNIYPSVEHSISTADPSSVVLNTPSLAVLVTDRITVFVSSAGTISTGCEIWWLFPGQRTAGEMSSLARSIQPGITADELSSLGFRRMGDTYIS
jgi:hypothetical protein